MGSSGSRVVQAIVGIATAVGGALVTACTFGGAGLLGSALIGAGVSGFMAACSGDGDWSNFGKSMLVGLAAGVVTGFIGAGASMLSAKLMTNFASVGAQWAARAAVCGAAGALSSVASTVAVNLMHGQKWSLGIWKAALAGCVTGGLSVASAWGVTHVHTRLALQEFWHKRLFATAWAAAEHAVGTTLASLIHHGNVDVATVGAAALMGGVCAYARAGVKVTRQQRTSTTKEGKYLGLAEKEITVGVEETISEEVLDQMKRTTKKITTSTTSSHRVRNLPGFAHAVDPSTAATVDKGINVLNKAIVQPLTTKTTTAHSVIHGGPMYDKPGSRVLTENSAALRPPRVAQGPAQPARPDPPIEVPSQTTRDAPPPRPKPPRPGGSGGFGGPPPPRKPPDTSSDDDSDAGGDLGLTQPSPAPNFTTQPPFSSPPALVAPPSQHMQPPNLLPGPTPASSVPFQPVPAVANPVISMRPRANVQPPASSLPSPAAPPSMQPSQLLPGSTPATSLPRPSAPTGAPDVPHVAHQPVPAVANAVIPMGPGDDESGSRSDYALAPPASMPNLADTTASSLPAPSAPPAEPVQPPLSFLASDMVPAVSPPLPLLASPAAPQHHASTLAVVPCASGSAPCISDHDLLEVPPTDPTTPDSSDADTTYDTAPSIVWVDLASELADKVEMLAPSAAQRGSGSGDQFIPVYATTAGSRRGVASGSAGTPYSHRSGADRGHQPKASKDEGLPRELQGRKRLGDADPDAVPGREAGGPTRGAAASSRQAPIGGPTQMPLVAQVLNILFYDEKTGKYNFKWESHLRMPEEKIRVIGIIGPQGSGKTLFAHSLIYEFGFALPKTKGATSWMNYPGVWMYVLREKGIVLLECTASTTDAVVENCADDAILTDPCTLFTLLASCHVVLHTSNFDTQCPLEKQKSLARAAAVDLANSAIMASQLDRLIAPQLTVVARGGNNLASQSSDPMSCINTDLAEKVFAARARHSGKKKEVEENIEKLFPQRSVMPLLYRPFSDCTGPRSATAKFEEQLSAIAAHLGTTLPHLASPAAEAELMKAVVDNRLSVGACLDLASQWYQLAKEVQSDKILEMQKQQASSSALIQLDLEHPQLKLKAWVDNVQNFLSKQPAEGHLAAKINEARSTLDKMGKRQEELSKIPEGTAKDEQDPWYSFRVGLIIAVALCEGGELDGNAVATQIGLQGLCLMGNADDVFLKVWVRLALEDYQVLALLSRPQVMVHPESWLFLRLVARSEFKLELLGWGVLRHVEGALTDTLSRPELRVTVLDVLGSMVESHKAAKVAKIKGSASLQALAKKAYSSMGPHAKRAVGKVAGRQDGSVRPVINEAMSAVRERLAEDNRPADHGWARADSDQVTAEAGKTEAQEKENDRALYDGAGARLSQEVSLEVARWCVERQRIALFLPRREEDEETVRKAKFLLLHRLAYLEDRNVSNALADCMPELFGKYFSEDRSYEFDVVHWSAHAANNIVAAEAGILREDREFLSKTQQGSRGGGAGPVTIFDVNAQLASQREEIHIGKVRLALLGAGGVKAALGMYLKAGREEWHKHQPVLAKLLRQLMVIRDPSHDEYKYTKISCEVLANGLIDILRSARDALQFLVDEVTSARSALAHLTDEHEQDGGAHHHEKRQELAFSRLSRQFERCEECVSLASWVLAFRIQQEKRLTEELFPIDPWKHLPERLCQILQADGASILDNAFWHLLLAMLNFDTGSWGDSWQHRVVSMAPKEEDAATLTARFVHLRHAVGVLIWNAQCCSGVSAVAARHAQSEGPAINTLQDLKEAQPVYAFDAKVLPKPVPGVEASSDADFPHLQHMLAHVPNEPADWGITHDVKSGWSASLRRTIEAAVQEQEEERRQKEELAELEKTYGAERADTRRAKALEAAEGRAAPGVAVQPEGEDENRAPFAPPRRLAAPEPERPTEKPSSPGSSASTLRTPDRRQQVKETAIGIKQRCAKGGPSTETLKGVLWNALQCKETLTPVRLQRDSDSFARKIAAVTEAVDLLLLCGFEAEGDKLVYTSSPANHKMCEVALASFA